MQISAITFFDKDQKEDIELSAVNKIENFDKQINRSSSNLNLNKPTYYEDESNSSNNNDNLCNKIVSRNSYEKLENVTKNVI